MSFWAYMLHCRGGFFYVGQTDDLDRRVLEHQTGLIPGFTADHQPVELVWSERFASRDDARAAERKLQSWSRAKKLALIRGDWGRISELATKKDGASTSSAWTGEGRELVCHPATPAGVTSISAKAKIDPNWLTLRWRIEGAAALVIPPLGGKRRADGLWQTTCFELFVRSDGEAGYSEFNLSPSELWAAYDFVGYREGMADRAMPRDPVCTFRLGSRFAIFDAAIPRAALPPLPARIGLSAVIEEQGGVKSYWALAHPPGKPDFHAPDCFALTLPAVELS